jgi:F-type H+-transporting ATPase subunit alpha
LFDSVALEQMPEAEQAVREAASALPAQTRGRLESVAGLGEDDRDAVLEALRLVLAGFSRPAPVPAS